MAIVSVNGGNPVYPGRVVDVVAETEADWSGSNAVELVDPIDGSYAIKILHSGTGLTRQIIIPGDMGGLRFTGVSGTAPARLATQTVGNPGTGIFPELNYVPVIGYRPTPWGPSNPASWYENELEVMKRIKAAVPAAFAISKMAVMAKVRWKEFYVDQTAAPANSTQGRDWQWTNYNWSLVDDMLSSPSILNNDAHLALLIAEGISSLQNAPPQFVHKDGGSGTLSWLEKGEENRWINRLDLPQLTTYVSDFYIALMHYLSQHAQADKVWSVVMGEYYIQDRASWQAAGVNKSAYMQGRRTIWQTVAANWPAMPGGLKIPILQTNPIFNNGVVSDDLFSQGIGTSQSDVYILDYGFYYDSGGLAPTALNGDTYFARIGHTFAWRGGVANPFGLSDGDQFQLTPEILFWNYASNSQGKPLDAVFLALDNNTWQSEANYIVGLQKYGRGGSETATWGEVPAHR